MSDHDSPEPQWGDPDAKFPYSVFASYDEYTAHMSSYAMGGLTIEQLDGYSCVVCGAGLTSDRAKVGEKRITCRTAGPDDGESVGVTHELYAGPCCADKITCPWWCDRKHEPKLPGNSIMDSASHSREMAELLGVIGYHGDRANTAIEIRQLEDEEGNVGDVYVNIRGTDFELDAAKLGQMAAALLNARDQLEQITGEHL